MSPIRGAVLPVVLIAAMVACGGQPATTTRDEPNVRADSAVRTQPPARNDPPASAARLATGLEGTMRRFPAKPVCRGGESCDAPLRASFEVRRQEQVVARFSSDSAGRFRVLLAPGAYAVVNDSGAPVHPRRQTHHVTVGPVGMTRVDLRFNSGIR